MKEEYDFSKGERGRFYRPNIELNIPIYLDHDVEKWFLDKAKAKGVNMQYLINDLLRKDIALIEGVTNHTQNI